MNTPMKTRMIAAVLSVSAVVIGQASAQTVEYLHTDALGSIVAVTNSAGQVTERREYEPYGRQLTPAALADGPSYTGHVNDGETGLVYMQQRYYDPNVGRLLSVDPVAADDAGGSFNRYDYASNNPYRFIDPDGRTEKCPGSTNPFCQSSIQISGTSVPGQPPGVPHQSHGFAENQNRSGWLSRAARRYICDDKFADCMDELLSAIPGEGRVYSVGKFSLSAVIAVKSLRFAGPSSRSLGQALTAAGFTRQAGDAAHHLVAGSARGAAPARAVLERFGIGINEAANGIFLPVSAHARIHTNSYYGAVNSALNQATTRQEALQVLQAVRQGVASGTFP